MRIRKRKVPLPLSLLSPVPLTDPHLFSRSPVEADHNLSTPTCSSDHVTIPTCCSASDLRPFPDCNHNTTTTNVSLPITGVEGVQISNDDSSNASITTSCAPADDDINNNNNGPLLLSNNEGVGRWCDGDGVIPLKKRRTMIAKRDVENEVEEEKKVKNNDGFSSDIINGDNNSSSNQANGKKSNGSKRGNTIMEGSRCSRVNGRGWRCCQQTLVGYSLCEHHLGKGRLRSMTSSSNTLKSRSSKKKNAINNNNNNNNNNSNNTICSFNTTGSGFELGNQDDQQEETYANNNKRIKLGVVKARSLSSLLGQTNTMNNVMGDHANMHPQQEKISN